MTKIRNKRKLRIFDVINACIMILLGFSFVVPFWIIACSSLSDNGQLMSKGISLWFRGFSFEGYAFLFQMSDVFFKSIISSLIVSFSNAALSVALCTGAAYVLAKKDLAGRKALNIFFMIPMFFGGGMIPLYLVIRGIKIYDTVWALIFPCAVRISNVLLLRNYFYRHPDFFERGGGAGRRKSVSDSYKNNYTARRSDDANDRHDYVCGQVEQLAGHVALFRFVEYQVVDDTICLMQILTDMQSLYGSLGGGSIVDAPLISARNAAVVIAVLPLVCLSPCCISIISRE